MQYLGLEYTEMLRYVWGLCYTVQRHCPQLSCTDSAVACELENHPVPFYGPVIPLKLLQGP